MGAQQIRATFWFWFSVSTQTHWGIFSSLPWHHYACMRWHLVLELALGRTSEVFCVFFCVVVVFLLCAKQRVAVATSRVQRVLPRRWDTDTDTHSRAPTSTRPLHLHTKLRCHAKHGGHPVVASMGTRAHRAGLCGSRWDQDLSSIWSGCDEPIDPTSTSNAAKSGNLGLSGCVSPSTSHFIHVFYIILFTHIAFFQPPVLALHRSNRIFIESIRQGQNHEFILYICTCFHSAEAFIRIDLPMLYLCMV